MKIFTRIMERDKRRKETRVFFKKGDQQFTEDVCNGEMTVDLVLQARAKLSDNEVSGPEDALVSEMIKILLLEKIFTIARCFQDRLMLVEDCETGFLKTRH